MPIAVDTIQAGVAYRYELWIFLERKFLKISECKLWLFSQNSGNILCILQFSNKEFSLKLSAEVVFPFLCNAEIGN